MIKSDILMQVNRLIPSKIWAPERPLGKMNTKDGHFRSDNRIDILYYYKDPHCFRNIERIVIKLEYRE